MQFEELFGHPAVQAGVVPFVVALVLAALLSRTRFLAFAQAAGVLACATLAIGWSFESLTSTRKLVLVAASTPVAALAIEAVGSSRVDLQACKLEYSIVSPK